MKTTETHNTHTANVRIVHPPITPYPSLLIRARFQARYAHANTLTFSLF